MVDKNFYNIKENVTLADVAKVTGANLTDSAKAGEKIKGIATMKSAQDDEICFFYDRKSKELAAELRLKLVLPPRLCSNFCRLTLWLWFAKTLKKPLFILTNICTPKKSLK